MCVYVHVCMCVCFRVCLCIFVCLFLFILLLLTLFYVLKVIKCRNQHLFWEYCINIKSFISHDNKRTDIIQIIQQKYKKIKIKHCAPYIDTYSTKEVNKCKINYKKTHSILRSYFCLSNFIWFIVFSIKWL